MMLSYNHLSSSVQRHTTIVLTAFVGILITPVLANFWNTIFVISTLGIGCAINNECARVVCEAGANRVKLNTATRVTCSANTTQWPDVGGRASFRDAGSICMNDGRCGLIDTTRYSFTGDDGLLNGRDWESIWRETGTTGSIHNIRLRMRRLNNDREKFGECQVSFTWGPGFNCRDCVVCDDGVSFRTDCSGFIINDIPAPDLNNSCYNLIFQPVGA